MTYRHPDFVLVSVPRSGSTWLQLALNGHPSLCCEGELLAIHSCACSLARLMPPFFRKAHQSVGSMHGQARLPWRRLTRLLNRSFGYCQYYARGNRLPLLFQEGLVPASADRQLHGFKVMRLHLLRFGEELLEYFREHCQFQITLVRENLLKRWISHFIAVHTMKFSSSERPSLRKKKWHIPVREMITGLSEFKCHQNEMKSFSLGKSNMEISYEDLRADSNSAWKELCEFLEVSLVPLPNVASYKQNPERVSEIVSNYDECADALRGSEFECFLD